MLLSLYRLLTHLGAPLIAYHLRRRVRLGKEDAERLGERFGRSSIDRPDGPLAWFHAASVGEAVAVLPLIERLLDDRPTLQILVTTGTVTSAKLMAARLPERAVHQFVPVDRSTTWRDFLDYWRPDAGFLVESEIWPNLILQAEIFGMPLTVINGRMSPGSFKHWQRAKGTASRLFQSFALCLARSESDGERFRHLGVKDVRSLGDLKQAAPSLPVDDEILTAWRPLFERRKVWLAASTHPGEEEQILDVHKALAKNFPGLLTIIVPRHPERGDGLARLVEAASLKAAQRSHQMIPEAATDIYLGDSVGELGLFYRLAPLVFVGGSLVPHGGQNPLEAARLDCGILFGPHTGNFKEITKRLLDQGAARRVQDKDHLHAILQGLLSDDEALAQMADCARRASFGEDAVIDRVLQALSPLLDRKTQHPVSLPSRKAIETADARP